MDISRYPGALLQPLRGSRPCRSALRVLLVLTVGLLLASAPPARGEVVALIFPVIDEAGGPAAYSRIVGLVDGIGGDVLVANVERSFGSGVIAVLPEWGVGVLKANTRLVSGFSAYACGPGDCAPASLAASIVTTTWAAGDELVAWFVGEGGVVVSRRDQHRAVLRGSPDLIQELAHRDELVSFEVFLGQADKTHSHLSPPVHSPDTSAHLGPGWPFVASAELHVDGKPLRAESRELSRDSAAFFVFDPDNAELVLKVLDGCGVNGHHWVYASGLTDLPVDLVIEDRRSGETWSYSSSGGSVFPGVADVEAFPCEPTG
jgi:hypothetical protein